MEALIETQITFLCVVVVPVVFVVVTTILATQTRTNPFITARDDHLEMNEPDKWKCAKTTCCRAYMESFESSFSCDKTKLCLPV